MTNILSKKRPKKRTLPLTLKKKIIRPKSRIDVGSIIEFRYGTKTPNKVGGWKQDPTPVILVLYDDGLNNILEGINLNYLTDIEFNKVLRVLYSKTFSKVDGKFLYEELKKKTGLVKAYRMYKRKSIDRILEWTEK